MEDFLNIILVGLTLGAFLGYLFFAFIGAALQLTNEVRNRSKESKRTPVEFSWKFFRVDNVKRFVGTIILIYVSIVFYEKLTGTELSAWSAFLTGYGMDGASGFLKKNGNTIKDKAKNIFKKKQDGSNCQ